tara:strand:+ start:1756 stop:2241 length:486 start_codon:yes stop_codon:yes gene_type:complete
MGKTRDGLTAKQMHFCRCVASGMAQAEAYREAFSVTAEGRTATHREAASRLMARADIRARVDALVAQRERSILASALSDRERVLSRLRQWTDTAEPADGNKIRAAELLGKSVGLFRDVVETSEGKTSDELLSELEAMLDSVPDNQPETEQSEPIPDDRSVH